MFKKHWSPTQKWVIHTKMFQAHKNWSGIPKLVILIKIRQVDKHLTATNKLGIYTKTSNVYINFSRIKTLVRDINIGHIRNNLSGTHKFGQVHYTKIFQAHKNCPIFKIYKF